MHHVQTGFGTGRAGSGYGRCSGVGKVAAQRFAEAGLGVVLADLAGETLEEAAAEIRAIAGDRPVLAVPTDVTDRKAVDALADAAFGAGEVAVLMNNAGIGLPTSSWTRPTTGAQSSRSTCLRAQRRARHSCRA